MLEPTGPREGVKRRPPLPGGESIGSMHPCSLWRKAGRTPRPAGAPGSRSDEARSDIVAPTRAAVPRPTGALHSAACGDHTANPVAQEAGDMRRLGEVSAGGEERPLAPVRGPPTPGARLLAKPLAAIAGMPRQPEGSVENLPAAGTSLVSQRTANVGAADEKAIEVAP
eukprot:8871473-Alexandrium_andersonii.AAC.1